VELAKPLIAAVVLLVLAGSSPARALDYPVRTATVIVPFAAGGPADITARLVADIFSRYLGQKFVVENVVGAGGTTGAIRAARAPADGYTILSGHLGTNALAPAFYPSLGYDPLKDFAPVGLTAEYPELLVARKDFPANDLREFIAYAKANPDKLNVGHAGLGSVSYIGCLLLHSAIGIKPMMVPFTGTAPVLNAMLAGSVDYECDPVLGTLSQIQAGNVKALAIAAKKRSPLLPDVPTSHEQGLPQFDIAPFYAVFVPAGTPQEIVDKLADALNKRRAGAARTEGARRTGAERTGTADADPEGRGGEVGGTIPVGWVERSETHHAGL
jgi:tripartite-type tricarboxylate transporter receptor subunit TctC